MSSTDPVTYDALGVVASTPDPATAALVGAVLRWLLTILPVFGITVGVVSNSTIAIVSTGIVGMATAGFALYLSIRDKYRTAALTHRGAVLSAVEGIAVKAVAQTVPKGANGPKQGITP